ncbi:uncharacterized protein MYCGRDRAFT_65995 [Zymoseptoria tritici IPO323]|uniref:tetrahydrofolate synthase n=1 Tax=Zymoseptoria tritici (strain CBS 115943 / IPO323) TaxID=336722 RepID=F9WY05_ZYMTI|nr:uncharacterized protein MYCGRDRAFT_65995 [Zymoseptoria tritici IPO323]EGP91231.1 hypothetical protein MYCGRDRAFT_65995 [Zymoseptoria tritici IPO323]
MSADLLSSATTLRLSRPWLRPTTAVSLSAKCRSFAFKASSNMAGGQRPGAGNYEDAVRLVNARRRQARPQEFSSDSIAPKPSQTSSGTPGLRGTPSIVGMLEWLQALGHSMEAINKLNIIHVAGTKGKGSTCAFAESILRAHGRRTGFPRKTGLYTSPHLMLPEERIRINYEPLSPWLFATYFFEVNDRLPELEAKYDPSKNVVDRGPRFLQMFALFAFHVFIREKVDVAIIETHSGGQYDATNVVQNPIVTAISTLGMDHIDMLGPTIENIAWHKAGIFKAGAVALSAVQDQGPSKVLKERAIEKGEDVRFVQLDTRLPLDSLNLQPRVQRKNASLAVAAASAFLARIGPDPIKDLTDEDIAAGVEQFSWPGRFQTLAEGNMTWFLDSAHNNMSVEIAAEWFAQAGRSLQITYDESEGDKSAHTSETLAPLDRAWASIAAPGKVWHEPTIQGAIALARRLSIGETQTLITGSQHLVGPALKVLGWAPKPT